jgi:FkbM family methyltransferase
MKKIIKKIVKYLINLIVNFVYIFRFGKYFLEKVDLSIHKQKHQFIYKNKKYKFFTPNRLNYDRAMTFLTKEPDTIEWIESFENEMVFWDVGANIGIFSCFAAKEKQAKTYAFEPSMFNLEILSKNIFYNNLSKEIVIVPISLNDKTKIDDFYMSDPRVGGAQSSFSQSISEEGKIFKPVFTYRTLGLSGNDLVQKLKIDKPNYIKIDVDGIEHLVLNGLSEILDETKSILIEVSNTFKVKKDHIRDFLEKNSFYMISKEKTDLKDGVFNQIWKKKNL